MPTSGRAAWPRVRLQRPVSTTGSRQTRLGVRLVVDAEAGLGVEEVQSARRDGELDRLPFARRTGAVETCDEEAALLLCLGRRRLDRLGADGRLDVGAADGRGPDSEVDEDLRPHVLSDVDDRRDRATLGRAARDARVLHVL